MRPALVPYRCDISVTDDAVTSDDSIRVLCAVAGDNEPVVDTEVVYELCVFDHRFVAVLRDRHWAVTYEGLASSPGDPESSTLRTSLSRECIHEIDKECDREAVYVSTLGFLVVVVAPVADAILEFLSDFLAFLL